MSSDSPYYLRLLLLIHPPSFCVHPPSARRSTPRSLDINSKVVSKTWKHFSPFPSSAFEIRNFSLIANKTDIYIYIWRYLINSAVMAMRDNVTTFNWRDDLAIAHKLSAPRWHCIFNSFQTFQHFYIPALCMNLHCITACYFNSRKKNTKILFFHDSTTIFLFVTIFLLNSLLYLIFLVLCTVRPVIAAHYFYNAFGLIYIR